MKTTRRIYNWVISWADKPGGEWALFTLAFAESSFFPIPPDVLLMALAFGAPQKSLRLATICGAGSVLGGIFGYGLGFWFMDSVGDSIIAAYGAEEGFSRIQQLYRDYDGWAVGIAGFTPIPYKIFTLAAGGFKISFPVFVAASLGSRFARFFLIAGVIMLFGERAKIFLEKHLDWAILIFTVALVGGFIIVGL